MLTGISYCYQGMVMQGSKLGNAFKWSTIKNITDYEQERDRQRIHALQMVDQKTSSTKCSIKWDKGPVGYQYELQFAIRI
jgi:hypothetical protein